MIRTHHTFIDAATITEDTWVYLYYTRRDGVPNSDGFKLNFRNKEMMDYFTEQDGKKYEIRSRSIMKANNEGCYHVTVSADRRTVSVELLSHPPSTGPMPMCFGVDDCEGEVAQCPEGFLPNCEGEAMSCKDPDN